MFLKKLTAKSIITVDYHTNGCSKTLKGRIQQLNLLDQIISLKDENQRIYSIRLSTIKNIS